MADFYVWASFDSVWSSFAANPIVESGSGREATIGDENGTIDLNDTTEFTYTGIPAGSGAYNGPYDMYSFTMPNGGTAVWMAGNGNSGGIVIPTNQTAYETLVAGTSFTISSGTQISTLAYSAIYVPPPPPVNVDPVAQNDSFTGDEDNQIIGNLLVNNGNGADSDSDGGTLSTSVLTQPTNGSVVVNSNGTFTYTPNSNYNGADSFTYTLWDGQGGSDTATVSLTVNPVNDDPVARDDIIVMDEDTQVTFNVFNDNGNGADSDIDGDTFTIADVTDPSNYSVFGVGFFSGNIFYRPAANYFGTDSFTYTITDDQGGTSTATVHITVNPVNDAPVAQDDSFTGNEDTDITGNLLSDNGNGADSDVDGGTLTTTLLTGPANGSVVVNTNGTFTYTPNGNYNGPDSFTYTLSDGQGGSDTATVSLTVNPVNDDPVARDDIIVMDEDTQVTFNLFDDNGNGADSDIDGGTFTITNFTYPTHASSFTIFYVSGQLIYRPAANYFGTDSFTYTISDGQGGTSTATVHITVNPVNDAPVARDDSITGNEDTDITGNLLADNGNGADRDVDGDTLTTTLLTGPANGSVVVNTNGTFTYTPDANYHGADSFTYTLSDGQGGSDTATVSLTVNSVNDAPVARDDSFTGNEDTQITGNLLSDNGNGADSDIDGGTLTTAVLTQPSHGTVVVNANGTFTYTPDANYHGADSFTYTLSDGQGGTDTATVSLTVNSVNDGPTGAVVARGTTVHNSRLTADITTLRDADGINGGTLRYQWLRDGVAISGATAASYLLTLADVGAAISVRVSYTDNDGTAEAVVSAPTAAVVMGDRIIGGTPGDDTLDTGPGDDVIAGLAGDDLIRGDGGDDQIYGGEGNDRLYGGSGNDIIGAGTGDDIIDAGTGNDFVTGGAGDDIIYGGPGDDQLAGAAGNDTIYGGAGNDDIGGGTGNDRLFGGLGNDQMGGGDGNDVLYGEAGDDFLAGGAGNDMLRGGNGADRLNGGSGNDILVGGPGPDVFIFNSFVNGELDVIMDFADGSDRLQMTGVAGGFGGLTITSTAMGSAISYAGHSIALLGVAVGDLDASDFIFV